MLSKLQIHYSLLAKTLIVVANHSYILTKKEYNGKPVLLVHVHFTVLFEKKKKSLYTKDKSFLTS